MAQITKPLTVYLPDTRGVKLSRYGQGNLKIGPGVYTYSRLPGRPDRPALGSVSGATGWHGTCPGSSEECERICYARRPVEELGPVSVMWLKNTYIGGVPPIPEDAKLVRAHISGDFDTVEYVEAWIARLTERPDVQFWAYTRSWRVASLLPALERLRALPNVQLFASMDKSIDDLPPRTPPCTCGVEYPGDLHMNECLMSNPRGWKPWRRAWIDGDPRAGAVHRILAHEQPWYSGDWSRMELQRTEDGVKALICPEETDAVKNCQECGFCISGVRNDVVFLEH